MSEECYHIRSWSLTQSLNICGVAMWMATWRNDQTSLEWKWIFHRKTGFYFLFKKTVIRRVLWFVTASLCCCHKHLVYFTLFSNFVWMWELDCEEGWVPKNWCFSTVVLEKTLESPLDCKEIEPVHSKGDQPWDFFGRNDAKAETPVLWPPHAKSWLIGKDSDAGRD